MSNNKTSPTKKKRRRQFGTVLRRPGGPGWIVQFPDPSGRRKPSGRTAVLTRSVASKAEGEVLLRELRKAAVTGALGIPQPAPETTDITVLEAIDGHVSSMRASGRKESSIEMIGYSRKAIERHGIGNKRVADLTVADVEQYLGWRRTHVWKTTRRPGEPPAARLVRGAKASGATVARDREVLCSALNRLIRMDVLEKNVVMRVPKPRRRKRQRVALSKEDVRKLLAECGKHLRPVVLTMLFTGARKGEVLRLRWRDLDFESRRISLYRPKTGNASTLPMHPALAEELAVLKAERKPKGSDAVFLSRFGRPMKNCSTAFANAVARAGLADRNVTPHVMRHTFAVHFLERGAAITDLQALLGHASLTTTQIYAQALDARTRSSVEALDFDSAIVASNQ